MKKLSIMLALMMALFVAVPAMAAPKEHVQGVKVVTSTVKTTNKDLQYPQVVIKDKKDVQDRINGYIDAEVKAFVKDHQTELTDKSTAIKTSYKIRYNANTILSLTLLEEGYTKTAAHGFVTMRGMNFSTADGSLITPADISKLDKVAKMADQFAPKYINKIIKEEVKAGKLTVLPGFKGITAAPADFYFDANTNIIAIFQPYEIAPYSAGVIELSLENSLLAH